MSSCPTSLLDQPSPTPNTLTTFSPLYPQLSPHFWYIKPSWAVLAVVSFLIRLDSLPFVRSIPSRGASHLAQDRRWLPACSTPIRLPLPSRTKTSDQSSLPLKCQRHSLDRSELVGRPMAKKQRQRKAQLGKKKQIDDLVKASMKKNAFSASTAPPPESPIKKPRVRMPLSEIPQPKTVTRAMQKLPRMILPGLPEDAPCRDPNWRIMDRRPDIPAIILPNEPEIQRSMRFERRGQFPFLQLPGELRNKIYDYAMPARRFSIDWMNGNQKSRTLTHTLPGRPGMFQPRLGPEIVAKRRLACSKRSCDMAERVAVLQDLQQQANSVALLWVCKAMYPEAASIFYGKAAFTFGKLGTVRHFLKTTSPRNKASITHLCIKHRAYGHPSKTADRVWKTKHDRLFTKLCWQLSDECSSLTHLALDLVLNKSPIAFCELDLGGHTLETRWMQPLHAFLDINIERCWCRLHCSTKDNAVLEVESWKVRQQILGDKWNAGVEGKRDAFGYDMMIVPAKKKGLILRLDMTGGDVFDTAQSLVVVA